MKIRLVATLALAQLLGITAQTEAQQTCAPGPSAVVETDTVIRLTFGNGNVVTLTDIPEGDGQTHYRYQGYLAAIGYHVVELVVWGGPTSWYELYNACTGTKLVVDGPPIVSSDSTRFVTQGYGVPRTPLVKRLQVWSRQPDGDFAPEWDFELGIWAKNQGPPSWGPANAHWVSPSSISFDRIDRQGRVLGTAQATLEARHWHFVSFP
jgi:hypothetical protein